ncbi:hypothetical protein CLOP_g12189 [Closterium sp. NIES-67]|nr:hypothetical protein CLOP_g12189 [Closterium sp. NIES-67]
MHRPGPRRAALCDPGGASRETCAWTLFGGLVRTGPSGGGGELSRCGGSPGKMKGDGTVGGDALAKTKKVARKAGPALAKIQCRAPIIRGVERATGNRCRLASSATPRPPWRAMGRWRASWAGGEPGRRRNSEASFLTGLSVDLGLEGGMEHTRLVRRCHPAAGRPPRHVERLGGWLAHLGPTHHTPAWGTRE